MRKTGLIISILFAALWLHAQEGPLAILEKAKLQSVHKHYEKAEKIINEGLEIYPADFDLLSYQVRLKLWQQDFEGAALKLNDMLAKYPDNYEVLFLNCTMYWWQNDWQQLSASADVALEWFPGNQYFIEKKMLALFNMQAYMEAKQYYSQMETPGPVLEEVYKQVMLKDHHQLKLLGSYASFDEVFTPWIIGGLSYQRTGKRTWIATISQGKLFDETGTRFEGMAYTPIVRDLRAIVGVGYSPSAVFPTLDLNAELVRKLASFELRLGGRFLQFEEENTSARILTYGVDKYFPKLYTNYKGFLLNEGDRNGTFTHSILVRYFLSSKYHYLQVNGSTGTTPRQVNSFQEVSRTEANAIQLTYSHLIGATYIVSGSLGTQSEVFSGGLERRRLSAEVMLSKLF